MRAKGIIKGPIEVSNQLDGHYHGPTKFDFLVDWGLELNRFRGYQTPSPHRWKTSKDLPQGVEVLEWQFKRVSQLMDKLTWLANRPQAYTNKGIKLEYKRTLGHIYDQIKGNNILDSTTPLGIIRAGQVAAEFLHPNQQSLLINMKRLPFKDGSFKVGIIDKGQVLKTNLRGRPLELDEVFLASGLTIASLLTVLNQEGNLPNQLEIIAPFATQPGIEWLMNLARDFHLQLRVITSRLYWYLDKNLYVWEDPSRPIYSQLQREGFHPVFAGGDAGDLTEI